MSLFIYQDGTLYADKRKVVNFPGGEIIKASIESKVIKTPYCFIAVGGFPHEDTSTYTDFVTALECLFAITKKLQALADNALKSSKKEINKFLSTVVDGAATAVGQATDFKDRPFLAMCHRRVWYYGIESTSVAWAEHHKDMAVVGTGELFAKILLTNNIHPKDVYPAGRKVGIPIGEVCETYHLKDISDVEPPYMKRAVWMYVIDKLRSVKNMSEQLDNFVDFLYFISLFSSKRKDVKLAGQRFITVDAFIHDWNNDKKFREKAFYKSLRDLFIEKQKEAA